MPSAFDLVLVSAFTGIGVALGQSVFKLWIEPHIKKIHKLQKRILKEAEL